MIIKDNGSGCEDIKKSYGLNGIVDRVKEVGGEVWFISRKGKGFTIKTLLPGGNTN
jgi:signal transduction histidine kinase